MAVTTEGNVPAGRGPNGDRTVIGVYRGTQLCMGDHLCSRLGLRRGSLQLQGGIGRLQFILYCLKTISWSLDFRATQKNETVYRKDSWAIYPTRIHTWKGQQGPDLWMQTGRAFPDREGLNL